MSFSHTSLTSEDTDTVLPGNGHVFGNFHQYYSFHPPTARTALFPPSLFRLLWESDGRPSTYRILDVGCNEGDLTRKLGDLAREQLPENVKIEVYGTDIDIELIARANNKKKSENEGTPDGVLLEFFSGDFLSMDGLERFHGRLHFVSVFSATMWFHLNHGDDGLRTLIERCTRLLVRIMFDCSSVFPCL